MALVLLVLLVGGLVVASLFYDGPILDAVAHLQQDLMTMVVALPVVAIMLYVFVKLIGGIGKATENAISMKSGNPVQQKPATMLDGKRLFYFVENADGTFSQNVLTCAAPRKGRSFEQDFENEMRVIVRAGRNIH